jgi:hypothetical protein
MRTTSFAGMPTTAVCADTADYLNLDRASCHNPTFERTKLNQISFIAFWFLLGWTHRRLVVLVVSSGIAILPMATLRLFVFLIYGPVAVFKT